MDVIVVRLSTEDAKRLADHLRNDDRAFESLVEDIDGQIAYIKREQERTAEWERRTEARRVAAMADDVPYTGGANCEIRVYSGARTDFAGHQCGRGAKWLRPNFDEWGDIALCGNHHSTATLFHRSRERVNHPTSGRLTRRQWAERKAIKHTQEGKGNA